MVIFKKNLSKTQNINRFIELIHIYLLAKSVCHNRGYLFPTSDLLIYKDLRTICSLELLSKIELCSNIRGNVPNSVQRRVIRLISKHKLTNHLLPLSHSRKIGDLAFFTLNSLISYRHQ